MNNGRGYFTDMTRWMMPVDNDYSMDVKFADVDNDCDLDIAIANLGQNKLYINYPIVQVFREVFT